MKDHIITLLKQRHDGYKIALEKEKDPSSKHAVDLIARMREDSQLIELIDTLPNQEPSNLTPKEQLDKDFEEIKKFNSNRMAIEEIDEYITRHTQNAYEMPDSHPLKGYCEGIDDTLCDILNILNKYYNE